MKKILAAVCILWVVSVSSVLAEQTYTVRKGHTVTISYPLKMEENIYDYTVRINSPEDIEKDLVIEAGLPDTLITPFKNGNYRFEYAVYKIGENYFEKIHSRDIILTVASP